jgi:predicted HD superfamily hydrolase involved in NAD metabolism
MRTTASKSELIAYLERRLSPERMKHVLGVRDTAMEYADAHGVDAESAETAALLHDAAKWMPMPAQFAECARYGVHLTREDRVSPVALHGYVAAEMGRERYEFEPEVCEAVRGHTTGKADMTDLDMVLYAADFSEPSRPFPEAAIARDLVMADLLDGVIRTMEFRLQALMRKGRLIHPRTVHARNALLARARS